MILRNISSCRSRMSSSIASNMAIIGGTTSCRLLQKCVSGVIDLQARGFSNKIRDPKDYKRYGGRPDDPPRTSGKWPGRPVEQKRADSSQPGDNKPPNKWTGRPEKTCVDRKKSGPREWTERPEDTNKPGKRCNDETEVTPRADDTRIPGKWTGRPEDTCKSLSKQKKGKSSASPSKPKDPGKGNGNTKASAAAPYPNISAPVQSAIVNVEMSGNTGLPPIDSVVSSCTISEAPLDNQVSRTVECDEAVKVIDIQGVVSTQLNEILGISKTRMNQSSSGESMKMAAVNSGSLERTTAPQKIPGWVPDVHQRSPVETPIQNPEKPAARPVELESTKPRVNSQQTKLKRPLDINIPVAPKLKMVKNVFNEKRRHRIYSFGLSETGALGHHKPSEKRRWRKFIPRPLRHQFAEETPVISAESGYGFTLFYVNSESNVKLYGCGLNTDFQLGPTDAEVITYPAPVDIHINSKNTKIVSFSAGRAHSAVATDNEGVFLFGANSYGQCGRGLDEEDKKSPVCTITQIKNFAGEKVVGVNCGQDHTCFITASGKLYSCGCGAEGQTGLAHSSHSYEPCLVQGDVKGENVVKVSGKCDTVLALNEKGELFGWGSNEFRQIVNDQDLPQVESPVRMNRVNKICGKIVDVAAGSTFCLVLNEEGDVYVWGYGILGGGPELERTAVPTLLPRTLFGANEYHPKVMPLRVYCGLDHMAVMNSLNHVYSWGKNKHGCLGIGMSRDQYFPYKLSISANAVHVTCAVDHSVIVTDHNS